MALKGRKPAMNIWDRGWRYQGMSEGISRTALAVRQGTSISPVVWRPTMPPTIVKGNDTRHHRVMITRMVCQGRAAVDLDCQATELTQLKMTIRGRGNTRLVITTFHVQFRPPIWRYRRLATKPPMKEVTTYRMMRAVSMLPLWVALKTPSRAQASSRVTVAISCTPAPIRAENRLEFTGIRNTSPWISFQPVSSSPMSSSSMSM
mmetsp:Transcript_6274/g.9516  ORF Transcript_6274/g.9516 Transcript_6274/m.9516 type:complete len:205 (+) Transcript_6274:703-1317(+)